MHMNETEMPAPDIRPRETTFLSDSITQAVKAAKSATTGRLIVHFFNLEFVG